MFQEELNSNQEMAEKKRKDALFERELYCHADALYNVAVYWSRDSYLADDLVQDTFIRAYKHIDSYQIGTNAKAWLFKILRHLWINKIRDIKDNHKDIEDIAKHHHSDTGRDFGLATINNSDDFSDEVFSALKKLSQEQQMLLLLREIEQCSYEELAEVFEVPTGTIRSRLHRVRRTLEDNLAEYAEKEGYHIKNREKK